MFNYINHKFVERGEKPGQTRRPDIPWRIHRLVFAAGLITDSAICYATSPPAEPDERYGIWDELHKGTEHELGWLGEPLGPPRRLATQKRDVLDDLDMARRFTAEGATIRVDGGRVHLTPVESAEADDADMKLTLHDVPCDGPDLFLRIIAEGDPLPDYPATTPRLMHAAAGKQRYPSWVGPEPFESGFYFKGMKDGPVDVVFTFEGRAPVTITKPRAYQAPDVIVRAYEHGLVLANPAPHPVTLDLADLQPDESYRRLRGSSKQDPETNNGQPVIGPLKLAGKDALFLVRQSSR